jgi:CheY-like chemotaxis protein
MYKILIVEDEEIERKALVDLLEEHFFETLIVYSATNGLEALEILKKIEIHILICDINLPGINGLETIASAKKINKDEKWLEKELKVRNIELLDIILMYQADNNSLIIYTLNEIERNFDT